MSDDRAEQVRKQFEEGERSCVGQELPRYRCHKEVYALKIAALVDPARPNEETDGSMLIVPADEGYYPFKVSQEYFKKHNPQVGGYYVVYKDGYKSFSPAQAFEKGYSRLRRL